MKVFYLLVVLISSTTYSQVVLTHNTSDDFIETSIYGCNDCCLRWSRIFNLSDFDIQDDLLLSSGTTAIRVSDPNFIRFQYNIYNIDDNFPSSFNESNLLGSSQEVTVRSTGNSFILVETEFEEPITIPTEIDKILVEIRQVEGEVVFMAGTEEDTDVSWFKSDAGGCPPENYTTTEDLNRPDARFFIKVFGEEFLSVGQNLSLKNTRIYPNPSKDFINIQTDIEFVNVAIVDIKGSIVLNNLRLENNKINISTLNSGLYFIQFTSLNRESNIIKFIKI